MEKNIIYGFVGGMFVGKYTGLIANFIITGMVIAFYSPEVYTSSNLQTIKEASLTFVKSIVK